MLDKFYPGEPGAWTGNGITSNARAACYPR